MVFVILEFVRKLSVVEWVVYFGCGVLWGWDWLWEKNVGCYLFLWLKMEYFGLVYCLRCFIVVCCIFEVVEIYLEEVFERVMLCFLGFVWSDCVYVIGWMIMVLKFERWVWDVGILWVFVFGSVLVWIDVYLNDCSSLKLFNWLSYFLKLG